MIRILIVFGVALIASALAIAIRSLSLDPGYTITPSPPASRHLEPRAPRQTPFEPRVVLQSTTSELRDADPSASEAISPTRNDLAPASHDATAAPGYLFDLAGLQDALGSGEVSAHFDAATAIDSEMAGRIVEATRSGFDAFLQIYNNRQDVETSTDEARAKLEEIIDFADLVAAVLPESRALILQKRIAIKVEFTATTAQTMLYSLDQPGGDLTVNILGNDTLIKLVIPHNVGPRSLWRRIYERIERRGQLPRRFRPSSIEGAGTLSLEALKRGN